MLTDQRIDQLLRESKPAIEANPLLRAFGASAPRRGHRRLTRRFRGDNGSSFVLHLRQSCIDAYDFSVILAVQLASGPAVNLRRHNGRGHAHRNKIENTRLPSAFHIHVATQRYQEQGHDIDGYAETTSEFDSLATALDAMLRVASFAPPTQPTLWQP